MTRGLVASADLWEVAHGVDVGMNGIDASTGSKVLVSSRVRGVLDGCAITDVGLPSKEEAIQMLMTGSGLSSDSAAPPEAAEVVRFCNHLPLAIAIAGRLLREIDVASGGWSGVVEMLSEDTVPTKFSGEVYKTKH